MNSLLMRPADMKMCFKCQRALSRSEFYRHPKMGDGLLGKCKDCARRDAAMHYRTKKNNEEWLARERARCVAKQCEYVATGRIPPDKMRARRAVGNAVARGTLTRPTTCERCGRQREIQAHHPDYSKPLDVQWLCVVCHAYVEGRLRPDHPQYAELAG